MIVSIFLKHFKIYKGISFVPLSKGDKFSSVIGENGVGKSSVLEALDFALNKRDHREWPVNNEEKQERGVKGSNAPYIAPVFLMHKDSLRKKTREDAHLFEEACKLSEYLWETTYTTKAKGMNKFLELRNELKKEFNSQDYLLILIGKKHDDAKNVFFGPYHNDFEAFLSKQNSTYELGTNYQNFYEYIASHYSYMHIPVETNPYEYTKLETVGMQKLMDKNIQSEIESAITKKTINQINAHLDEFVNKIESTLGTYKYKGHYKNNLTMPDLVSKIIEAYFSIKVLNKKSESGQLVPVYDLSSGEKRKALIDIAYSFLKRGKHEHQNIILAIDEPEASLHISACYQQFERLMELSNIGSQIILSTHWYGYLPIIARGTATSIQKDSKGQMDIEHLDLFNYREKITHERKKVKGPLPFDINLKSYNDLVQSIVFSLMSENLYRWIVCEGLSEKIYFEHIFSDIDNLKILPVGGYKEVKKVYENLLSPINDPDYNVKGKVLCLIDTDEERLDIDYKKGKRLFFERLLINEQGEATLVDVNDNKTKPTEIEDCLDPETYYRTLTFFSQKHEALKQVIQNNPFIESSSSSANCMDLRPTDSKIVKDFFNENRGENKLNFARKYVEVLIEQESEKEQKWIKQIRQKLELD